MQIKYHRKFKKSLAKQSAKIQNKFFEKLEVFSNNQFHHTLNNHALAGDFLEWRSINISGDVRVHYAEVENTIVLMDIGTHAKLYK